MHSEIKRLDLLPQMLFTLTEKSHIIVRDGESSRPFTMTEPGVKAIAQAGAKTDIWQRCRR